MNKSPREILQQYWNFSSFRGEQENIVNAVLQQKDTLALLPTGGGKSICFQVPALIMDGLCIVISPLIALMRDQVENLRKREIPAAALFAGMTYFEVNQTLQNAVSGSYKFLYLSPERLQTRLFKEFLPALDVSLIAVDEAHCISQWGYDFRPPYLKIAELRDELPGVPVIALTASATWKVQDDIIQKLQLQHGCVYRQSFARENLSYSVFNVDSKINKVIEVQSNVAGSSLVYCRNRRQTQNVTHLLQLQNFSADYYHAGIAQEERSRKQVEWLSGKTRTIVCTNAFGMGIDKPNVRTVIHYDLPDCLENYYQEAGRAGRDGNRAYAVAVYIPQDLEELRRLPGIKFPPIAEIKKVYQSIADYLNIPVGLGEGNYYDFDLLEFSKNFKYDVHLVMNVLKALESEGHLAFNENIFLPSQVSFTAPKEILESFEDAHPELEPIIKCLLRTYEGIYENRVSVNEKNIARLAGLPVEKAGEQLIQLRSFGIIEYLPKKETPQVYFILNRAPAEYLHINIDAYLARKKQYEERVNAMLEYMQTKSCRSQFIASYFGEVDPGKCGVCDNCLAERSAGLSEAEFKKITERIYAHIPVGGIDIKELLPLMKDVRKEKVWKVLDFLQAERKLLVENSCIKNPVHLR
jgi:ATP-dependent DNA helicase RecQ